MLHYKTLVLVGCLLLVSVGCSSKEKDKPALEGSYHTQPPAATMSDMEILNTVSVGLATNLAPTYAPITAANAAQLVEVGNVETGGEVGEIALSPDGALLLVASGGNIEIRNTADL